MNAIEMTETFMLYRVTALETVTYSVNDEVLVSEVVAYDVVHGDFDYAVEMRERLSRKPNTRVLFSTRLSHC